MTWIAIALIGISHLFVGYMFAVWVLPGHIGVGMTSRIPMRVFASVAILWAIGAGLFVSVNGFQVTKLQTGILVGCVLSSYAYHRGLFSATQPKTPWEEYLNKRFQVAVEICRRHGWASDSQTALRQLADTNHLKFDGGDYDLLIQVQGEEERKLRSKYPRDPLLPDGQINYDLACAREIESLSAVLLGSEHFAGVVADVADETDTSKLDRAAMDALRWLGEAVQMQWGLEALHTGM